MAPFVPRREAACGLLPPGRARRAHQRIPCRAGGRGATGCWGAGGPGAAWGFWLGPAAAPGESVVGGEALVTLGRSGRELAVGEYLSSPSESKLVPVVALGLHAHGGP